MYQTHKYVILWLIGLLGIQSLIISSKIILGIYINIYSRTFIPHRLEFIDQHATELLSI